MLTVDDMGVFINGQVDKDEQVALAATAGPWRYNPGKHWRTPDTVQFEEFVGAGPLNAAVCVAATGETDDPQSMADATFIARQDPARALAEVAAKRRIMAVHVPVMAYGEVYCRGCGLGNDGEFGGPIDECPERRALAAVYATEPDYRQEWAPDE